MSHLCHAHGCNRKIPPKLMFCAPHWRAVRPELQRAVWKEYRQGQEVDKRPSFRYLAVQQLAVAESAFCPNDEQAALDSLPYLENAFRFRELAIREGYGDPLQGLVPK